MARSARRPRSSGSATPKSRRMVRSRTVYRRAASATARPRGGATGLPQPGVRACHDDCLCR
jgi:hypothetical protein